MISMGSKGNIPNPNEGAAIQQARLVRTLQQLVRIPSHESCREISRHIAGEIRKLGIEPDVDKDGNIIARTGSGQGLLLNAHTDTVGVKDYSDAFSGKVSGSRLYGRGSTDDKSGVAAMLEIMRALQKNPPRKQIISAFTVGEEDGDENTDGAYSVAKRVKATHAITLEPSVPENSREIGITIGCKGRFVYNIDVLGRAAHSGRPWMGRNSIYLASKLIEKLMNFKTAPMKITGYGKISPYLSVTQIDANEGSNVIPAKCSLTVDYRALPGDKESEIRRKIQQICRIMPGGSCRVSLMKSPKEGYTETDPEFLRLSMGGISEAGMKPFTDFSHGWIDGMVFKKSGLATLNTGPGTTGQAHRNPEHCWIPGLVKGTRAVLSIIRRWDAQ